MWRGIWPTVRRDLGFQLTHLYEMWLPRRVLPDSSRHFNSHISMRCDRFKSIRSEMPGHFNSHISMRCDKPFRRGGSACSLFQLTHLYEMWRCPQSSPRGQSDFNSHITMRCDGPHCFQHGQIQLYFNSHISMRCDQPPAGNFNRVFAISTHTSLWDVTQRIS